MRLNPLRVRLRVLGLLLVMLGALRRVALA